MNTRILPLFCLFAAFGGDALAQAVEGSIRGLVSDPSGQVVRNAALTLTDSATGAERTTESGANGAYGFAGLPAGRYRLEISAAGFQSELREDVTVRVAANVREDFRLVIGEERQQVTVTAQAPLLEQESAAVGAVIPNNYVVNLPLDGRNWMELALLVAGTTPAAAGSPGTERGRFAFQAAGARESANSFVYDGVYAIDPTLNSFTFTPPVDAIEEFRLQTANADAGLGRNSGGQVAVALKRGGNQFHGSVYEFLRNDALDARNFFDRPDAAQPALRRNQFGFSLGGPVVRRSTFFFGDFEGLRERRAVTRTTNTPTAAERQGDFSQSALPQPIDFSTFQLFPNAQVPAAYLHPVGQGVAALYPLPNRAAVGQNFVSAPTLRDDTNKFDIRLDQRLGAGTLSGRYSFADRDRFEPFAAQQFSNVPGYGNDVAERGQNLMLGETHSFGSRWVNDVRFGFNRVDSRISQQNAGVSINQTVGLPDYAARPRDLGLSFIQVTGLSSLGDEFNNPGDSVMDSWQISDTLSHTRGRHSLEAGFEQRWIAGNAFRDVLSRGQLSFTDFAYTQSAFADLLMGLPTYTLAARSDSAQNQRTSATNLFVDDAWRLRPNLTLHLGLRYELNQPVYDANNAAAIYDQTSMQIVQLGSNGVPRGGYRADRNNLAPRVGLAWSPGGSRTRVVRAGYGLHYNFSPLAAGQGIYFNPPFFNTELFYPSATAPIVIHDPWPSGGAAALPPSALTYDPNLVSGYAQNWSFSVQQEISGELVLTAGYVGTRGVHLLGSRDINQPAPSAAQPNLRPLPFFSDINQIESSFDSVYHSLQLSAQCRFQEGLTGLFSYTWSRSIDNASNFFPSAGDANFPQNSYDTTAERGRSSFDTPHRFVGSFAYELPGGRKLRGAAKQILAGWRVNGVVTLQSGQPYTVALPGELDNSNTGQSIQGFGAGDRPNLVGDPSFANPDPAQWINPAAFAMPAYGTFGNAGRNIVQGPPLHEVNFSLNKNAKLSDALTLQLRTELFNMFNTPNFRNPNIFFGTPGFGRILSARNGREIQFGVKLLF
ncbi:MAG: TonB-dependent receptor [Bryobacterales bacterium]|nr:TonB-dependent receptor [Bryobacterales bacterium]